MLIVEPHINYYFTVFCCIVKKLYDFYIATESLLLKLLPKTNLEKYKDNLRIKNLLKKLSRRL